MSEETARVSRTKLLTTIPPLQHLLFEQCGYVVPPNFTLDFVGLHGQNWLNAERDWEKIVALVLDTDAVDPRANGAEAIRQAVEAAATFLADDELWPWCPICKRGTATEPKEETGGN